VTKYKQKRVFKITDKTDKNHVLDGRLGQMLSIYLMVGHRVAESLEVPKNVLSIYVKVGIFLD
jgi:hypothetical protein